MLPQLHCFRRFLETVAKALAWDEMVQICKDMIISNYIDNPPAMSRAKSNNTDQRGGCP